MRPRPTSERVEICYESTAGSPEPEVRMSPEHPASIQNEVYAAARLSCSFGATHSINFILLGEIRNLMPLAQ